MLKRLLLLAALLSLTLACVTLVPSPTPPQPTSIFPTETSQHTVTPSAETPAGESFLGLPWGNADFYAPGLLNGNIDLAGATEYHLAFVIQENLSSLTGRVEILYTNREEKPLAEIWLRLYPNIIGGELEITNLTLDGQTPPTRLDLQNSLLIVTPGEALRPGQSTRLGMDFSLNVPTDNFSNYGVLAAVDGVLTLAHAYPMVAVYDESGWNAEVPPVYGDLTYADASFYIVRVTAPAGLALAASGRQVSSEITGDTQTALFALGPGRDFMLAALRDYIVETRQSNGVTLNAYAPASADPQYNQVVLDTAEESLRIFGQRYAPYPYSEYDLVATPTFALGVEYPGLVALSTQLYDPSAPDFYLESTVAHETGHQWFYNLVGDDQLDQPWLDESLTQFITWQYYADRYGQTAAEGFKESLTSRWQNVDNAPIPVGQPVAAYSDREYSAIVYGRGALFFFALRDEIGQEAFDVFLKTYTTRYSWNIATTEALKTTAEATCGCDLTPLFAQWVFEQ